MCRVSYNFSMVGSVFLFFSFDCLLLYHLIGFSARWLVGPQITLGWRWMEEEKIGICQIFISDSILSKLISLTFNA